MKRFWGVDFLVHSLVSSVCLRPERERERERESRRAIVERAIEVDGMSQWRAAAAAS